MANVLPMRANLQVLHVRFQDFDLNPRQAEHGPIVIDQLPDERSGAPQAFCLFLDGGGLLRSEAERLGEVVVSRGRPRHCIHLLWDVNRLASLGDLSQSQESFKPSDVIKAKISITSIVLSKYLVCTVCRYPCIRSSPPTDLLPMSCLHPAPPAAPPLTWF